MKTINSYRKSPVYIINIKYGKERVTFNLVEELKFNPDIINDDLKKQPIKYGFCLLIHKKLLTHWERLKAERKRVYGKLYFKAKERKLNGRAYSDDLCKAWVEKHDDYIKATEACIRVKDWADQLFSCIRAFEQRKDLMQTISSNMRKES